MASNGTGRRVLAVLMQRSSPINLTVSTLSIDDTRVSARWWRVLLLVSTTAILLAASITVAPLLNLKFNDDPRLLFRTDTDGYQQYQHFANRFPHELVDLGVLVQGDILSPDNLAALREASDTLAELDSVEAIYSLLSEPRYAKLAIASINQEAGAAEKLKKALTDSQRLPTKLIADNLQTSALLIALKPEVLSDSSVLSESIAAVQSTLENSLDSTALEISFQGFPALRVAVKQQVLHDMLLFGTLAVLFSAIVAWFMFRSVLVVGLALLGPLLAVLCTFAVVSLITPGINVLTQMVSVLILVVGFSDSVHIARVSRQCIDAGMTPTNTLLSTYKRLALPCLLTSLTTAAGFLSLMFSKSHLISEFGLICAIGCVLGFLAVMLSAPLGVAGAAWQASRKLPRADRRSVPGKAAFESYPDWLVLPARLDYFVIALGFGLTLIMILIASQIKPQYKIGENLPPDNTVKEAVNIADKELGGSLPLHVMLSVESGSSTNLLFKNVRQVQKQLNKHSSLIWVSSIDSSRYAPGFGTTNRLRLLPDDVVERQYHSASSSALISTMIPALGSQDINPLLVELQTIVDSANTDSSVRINLTGFTTILGSASEQMIRDLGVSLLSAVILIWAITTVLFKSVRLGFISLLPNIAPVAALGAILVLCNQPLRYSAVVVFSICLGIAIDDTIHVIARFQQQVRSGLSTNDAVLTTLRDTGPVLLLSSAVMAAGFAALLFSSTTTLAWMGILCCSALLGAVIVDLTLLPALLRRFYRVSGKFG